MSRIRLLNLITLYNRVTAEGHLGIWTVHPRGVVWTYWASTPRELQSEFM